VFPGSDHPRFTIVGAGLGGALLACHLGKAGHRVDVYEKRDDPRMHGAERGRSINLALSVRGIQALREVGLAETVLQASIPLRGRMIHSPAGQLTFQPYGKDESECIHSVSRAGLNQILLDAATKHEGVRIFFGRRCTGIDLHSNTVELTGRDQAASQIACDIVVGADGAFSAIRAQMQKQERFDFQQDYLSHGYKELTIPAGPGGTFALEKNALHIWPRRSFMMIALPNLDGSFTCTLFWAFDGPNSFAQIKDQDDLRRFFDAQFLDAMPLLPNLAHEYFTNPTGSLVTIRCSPWHVGGRVVLLGDAAHAVVPFLGQGMNAAFEDCTVLARCLAANAPNYETAFASFEKQRKKNVDTLADLCIDNFLEMRDRVGSRWFLLRKKMQNLLHKLLPRWYLPLYTMVSFTTIPYAAALRRARRQDRIVRGIGIGLVLALAFLGLWWW
jgi:kynurenine 3-monooxygenase